MVKMPDGGFRPAYNMQIASVAGGQVVVAVDVSTSSSDRGLARPMLEKIEATYGKLPESSIWSMAASARMTILNGRMAPKSRSIARRPPTSTIPIRLRRARTMDPA